MIYVIRRSILSVKELERIEKEEVEHEVTHIVENRPPSSDFNHLDEVFIDDWNSLYLEVVLNPLIMVNFRLVDRIRQIIVSSSPG